jgi:hypothetical protein
MAGGHEQAVALDPAEADVGAALGQGDAANLRPVGGEDQDPVERLAAHAPAAPQVAVDIAAHAVGGAAGAGRRAKVHVCRRPVKAATISRTELGTRGGTGLTRQLRRGEE